MEEIVQRRLSSDSASSTQSRASQNFADLRTKVLPINSKLILENFEFDLMNPDVIESMVSIRSCINVH